MGRLLKLLGGAPLPWYKSPSLKADGVSPSLVLDFVNDRYAVNGASYDLDANVVFTRASAATYVDKTGVIRSEGYNLFLQSETFDNASWTKAFCSITANGATAPNGKQTADLMVESAVANEHYLEQIISPVAATTYSMSIYVRPTRGRQYFSLRAVYSNGANDTSFRYDLTNGTMLQVGAGMTATASISAPDIFGNRRLTLTVTTPAVNPTASLLCRFSGTNAAGAGNYLGSGLDEYVIWGAQFELSDRTTDYSPTTTAANSSMRKQHYHPKTLAVEGFLNESANTNLVPHSDTLLLSSGAYSAVGVTVANGVGLAPDGTNNMTSIKDDLTNAQHYYGVTNLSFTLGTTYTISVFVKKDQHKIVQLTGSAAIFGVNIWANFDVELGTVTAQGSAVTKVQIEEYPNGVFRCSMSGAATGTGVANVLVLLTGNNPTALRAASYLGTGSGVFAWGLQVEATSYTSSFIYTKGAAVTRAVDSAYLPSSSIYTIGQSYTMWAEVKRYWVSNAGASFVAQGLDDGGTNRSQLGGIGLSLNVYHNCGGVLVSFGATLPLLANTVCRLAMAVATGAISFASRGTTDTGGATTVLPTAVTRLYICNAAVSRTALDGVTRELRFWKANKITNSELQRITT